MTIPEARKTLELSEEDYSDEQVEQIIDETFRLAKFFLDRYRSGGIHSEESQEGMKELFKNQKSLKLFMKLDEQNPQN